MHSRGDLLHNKLHILDYMHSRGGICPVCYKIAKPAYHPGPSISGMVGHSREAEAGIVGVECHAWHQLIPRQPRQNDFLLANILLFCTQCLAQDPTQRATRNICTFRTGDTKGCTLKGYSMRPDMSRVYVTVQSRVFNSCVQARVQPTARCHAASHRPT